MGTRRSFADRGDRPPIARGLDVSIELSRDEFHWHWPASSTIHRVIRHRNIRTMVAR